MSGLKGATPQEFAMADRLAAASQLATKAVEQAGRGMSVVMSRIEANASDLETIMTLLACQDYLCVAMTALVDRERMQRVSSDKPLVIGA